MGPWSSTGRVGVEAVHLMALCEEEDVIAGDGALSCTPSRHSRYGFAFLDAAAGRYYVGTASDGAGRGNLGALLMQVCVSRSTCRGCNTRPLSSVIMRCLSRGLL